MANEEKDFTPFISALSSVLDELPETTIYLVTDLASKDKTTFLCQELGERDKRFISVFDPGNQNVVDAYRRGYREAYARGHDFIVEMDAGLSHDPRLLHTFFDAYQQGYDCVLGSRFMQKGDMTSSFKRNFLSKGGTLLANTLLGTRLTDMTSGYQGFERTIVEKILAYPLRSRAHFYQTEIRYLIRKEKCIETPITYRAPSPGVSGTAIRNAIAVLLYYLFKRLTFQAPDIQTI
jgi:dolichol-phosphate mannosyltransferase